jgi:hypothetical protein
VEGPVTWISGLSAITKGLGDFRWVAIMMGPNKAIKHPYYPMPTIEEIAVKMARTKYFEKLDLKDAFFTSCGKRNPVS